MTTDNSPGKRRPEHKKKLTETGKKIWHDGKSLAHRMRGVKVSPGWSLYFQALWRNIKSFRPRFKGFDMRKYRAIFRRPDFLHFILTAAVGVWILGTIIAGLTRVRESEVGLQINNITGSMQIQDKAGIYFFNPYFSNFYTLPKTVQTLDMSASREAMTSPDEVRIKTRDGSNVSLDVTINYKLIPTKADIVIRRSGKGLSYSEKWIRTYTRAVANDRFGELNTEEFYDTALRNDKARLARQDLNRLLNPFGMEIVSVIPRGFRFYQEYEQVIKARKVADQSVEEQIAKAANAVEEQRKYVTEEKSKAAVQIARAIGDAERKIVEASGRARKAMIDAEGYAYQTQVGAEAGLFRAQKEAEGILAMGEAEAKGYRRLREALQGSGGQNLIALEYARRLKEIELTGTPVTHEGHVPRIDLRGLANPSQGASKNE